MKTKMLLTAALIGAATLSANAGIHFGFSIGLPLPVVVVAPPVVIAPAIAVAAPCPAPGYWSGSSYHRCGVPGGWPYRDGGYGSRGCRHTPGGYR